MQQKPVSTEHDDVRLRVAFGRAKNKAKVENVRLTWGELRKRLSTPFIDTLYSLEEFSKLPKSERDARKDVGFLLGGHIKEGHRKNENVTSRWVATLDLDAGDRKLLNTIELGLSTLCQYEFYVHSTRNHTPDAPRLRILLPLSSAIESESYGPLMRILASMIDTSGDLTDVTCFRVAQMMFLPSICRGAEFFSFHNEGDVVDPQQVLTDWGDWRDYTQLPKFAKDADTLRPSSKKAEDPRTKRGIVGAFCRTYSITEAIAQFIPEVYLEGVTTDGYPRYSFAAGSTANGVIVYDDDSLLYSHHATDPCGGRAINAFDMVRTHLFRELDEDVKEGTSPGAHPSFKQMHTFLERDDGVRQALAEDAVDAVAVFEDLTAGSLEDEDEDPACDVEEVPPDPDLDWLHTLDVTAQGVIKPTLSNAVKIIGNDPRFKKSIQLNEFTREIVSRKPVKTNLNFVPALHIFDKINGDLWSDLGDDVIRAILENPQGKGSAGYGLKLSDRDIESAVNLVANRNAFHPVKEYLERLAWDGTQRVDSLFIDYCGVEDTAYSRAVSRMTLLAAVTRIYEPGHKFDFIPVLEGYQGLRKSSFIKTLAKNWFSELSADFDDTKRCVENMQGSWILEVPELNQFSRASINVFKQFVSTSADKTRLAYDRRAKVFKRQCIFIATTNEKTYNRDDTGARRIWPMMCSHELIDTDLLAENVDQLWAEVLLIYREMRKKQPVGTLPLYLVDVSVREEAEAHQARRKVETEEDGLIGLISEWLDVPVPAGYLLRQDPGNFSGLDSDEHEYRERVCLTEIYLECLNGRLQDYGRSTQLKLGRVMQQIPGWAPPKMARHGPYGTQRVYERIRKKFDCV